MKNQNINIKEKKQKNIIQNSIVRKRLSVANFFKQNVKNITNNFDFILCIPINGFNSEMIQNIRFELLKYGYNVNKYTTKSFFEFLCKNQLILKKNEMSQFYLGQMLIVTIRLNYLNFRDKQLKELYCLQFFQNYLQLNNLNNFSSLLYNYKESSNIRLGSNSEKKNKLIIKKMSENDLNLSVFKSKLNINFLTLTSNISNLLSLLISQILFLLNLLILKTKLNQIK